MEGLFQGRCKNTAGDNERQERRALVHQRPGVWRDGEGLADLPVPPASEPIGESPNPTLI